MSDIVERVARAIYEAAWGPGAWLLVAPGETEHMEATAQARAALEAMREPTEAMIIAVDREEKIEGHIHYDNMPADQAWLIMIDEALKP